MDEDRIFQAIVQLGKEFGELRTGIEIRLTALEERFTSLETRITGLEERITSLEARVTGLEERITSLEARVTGLEERITSFETRVTGLENRITGVENSISALEKRFSFWDETIAYKFNVMDERFNQLELKMERGFDEVNRRLDSVEVDNELIKGMVLSHDRKLRHAN